MLKQSEPAFGGESVAARCSQFVSGFEYTLFEQSVDEVDAECLVVTMSSDRELSVSARLLDAQLGGAISKLVERGTLTGGKGNAMFMPLFDYPKARAVLVLGTGVYGELSDDGFAGLLSLVYDQIIQYRIGHAALFLDELEVAGRDHCWKTRHKIIALEQYAYRYGRQSGESIVRISLRGDASDSEAMREGLAFSAAIATARTLGDTPANICTPRFLADVATTLGESSDAVAVRVLDEQQMEALGMHVLLSVGRGSEEPSRLIEMTYQGGDTDAAPVVLIGKGVTFDTGGTALKTRDGMRLMKYDMCGAASVIGVMQAIEMLALPINVVGLCACAENMPGKAATKPGDTVMSMSGKRVEILNPDAEGRLLLCDTLTYAERFSPALVVDVATLTGATLVALGRHYSALLSNDDALAEDLSDAGIECLDRAWRLPLIQQDDAQLDTAFADVANMGDGTAGCIVAGLFLARFAGAFRWAHLDVSSTAKREGDNPAATGRPAALLLQFLLNHSDAIGGRV